VSTIKKDSLWIFQPHRTVLINNKTTKQHYLFFHYIYGLLPRRRVQTHIQLPLQRRRLLRVIRVRIYLVPLEELGRAQNRVRGHIEVEVLLDGARRNVPVESGHLADQLDLLLRQLALAACARLVVDGVGLQVLFEKGAHRLATHLDVVLLLQYVHDVNDPLVLLEPQLEDPVLGVG